MPEEMNGDNKAIPVEVDPHDHSPHFWSLNDKDLTVYDGPGFDPEDVVRRLNDLASQIEKLEKELIGLATLMSKISPRRIERLEKEMQSLLEKSQD